MRNHFVRVTLGVSALFSVAAIVAANAIGCGSDDTAVIGDAGRDVTVPDVQADVPPPVDSGVDTGHDAGMDVTDAAETSTIPDVGVPDGDASALVPVGNFPQQATLAYCQRLQSCCCVTTDAAAFNFSECVSAISGSGEFLELSVYAQIPGDGGYVARPGAQILLDPIAAAQCIESISGMACTGLTAAQYAALVRECFGSMKPQVPLDGGGCQNAGDCQSGYCAGVGAEGGTCEPLFDAGVPCDPAFGRSDECTYQGLGIPSNHCAPIDDAGDYACEPSLPLDAGCGQNWDCQSYSCYGFSSAICQNNFIVSDNGVSGGICDFLGCLH